MALSGLLTIGLRDPLPQRCVGNLLRTIPAFGRDELRDAGASAGSEVTKPDCVQIERALESRGVAGDFSRAIAPRLEDRLGSLRADQREALLDGVAVASALHRETSGKLRESLQGLREVERMMGAFSGELSKLDEVLEVLAAYVQRMRSSGPRDSTQTLH